MNAHGLQTDNATSYCMEMLRPTSMSLATMQARMEAVCLFQNWCGENGIDFLERLETGTFFLQQEVGALRGALRTRRKASTGGRRRFKKGAAPGNRGTRALAQPLRRSRDYVKWFAEGIIQRMSVRDERLPEMRARLTDFAENIVDGITIRRSPMREGLTEAHEKTFLKAITPGDPSNPFAARNHARNEALWLTYFDGGVRLGEGLGLKTIDCHLNGVDRKLIVERRPDDLDDPRLRPALTKTLPHPVPIGPHLAHVLHGFIVNHRPSYPGAKRSPYLFLSEDGGPLTQATVAYMYRRLRETVPGLPKKFSTNDARRAWNNRFALGAEEAALTDTASLAAANQAQGRVPTSVQGETYRGRYNQKKAAEIMQRMEDAAVHVIKEAT